MICQLWQFAELRKVPLLQNDAIALLIQTVAETKRVPLGQVTYIYTRTTPNSPLRRVFIDLVSRIVGRKILEDAKQWPKEALVDLATANWADQKTVHVTEIRDSFQASDYFVLERQNSAA